MLANNASPAVINNFEHVQDCFSHLANAKIEQTGWRLLAHARSSKRPNTISWDNEDAASLQAGSQRLVELFAKSNIGITADAQTKWYEALVKKGVTKADAAKVFLDLNGGPTPADSRVGKSLGSSPAFLSPSVLGSNATAVARTLYDSPFADGVYLLAGVRGSGKSTLLNFIDRYVRNEGKKPGEGGRVLVMRCDLGTAVDERRFTLDLAAEACRQAKKQLPVRAWPFRYLSCIGYWCGANIWWAVAALLVFSALAAARNIMGPQTAGTKNQEVHGLLGLALIIAFPTLGMAFIGTANNSRRVKVADHQDPERKRPIPQSAAAITGVWSAVVRFFATLALILAAILTMLPLVWSLLRGGGQQAAAPTATSADIAQLLSYSPLVAAVLLALSVGGLAPWTFEYARVRTMLDVLRARGDARSPDFPLPFGLDAVVRSLLPHGNDENQLQEWSVPFLQDQLMSTMRTITRLYDRIVVLVDDVDALPSDEFHKILRLLRPLSKVSGVRCLVAAPRYWYAEYKSACLGDLHSTFRGALFMGDPSLFSSEAGRFAPQTNPKFIGTDSMIYDSVSGSPLYRLLASRLRLVVSNEAKADIPQPLQDILLAWHKAESEAGWADKVNHFLTNCGPSRRALLREVEACLDVQAPHVNQTVSRIPLSGDEAAKCDSPPTADMSWERVADEWAVKYAIAETSLLFSKSFRKRDIRDDKGKFKRWEGGAA